MPDLDLEKALEIIIMQMQRKRMLPEGLPLRAVVDNIVKEFKKHNCTIDLNDLQNPENALALQKALMFCIVSESIGMKNPDLRIDYVATFKPLNKPELKKHPEKLLSEEKKLKMRFKKLLTVINNKLNPIMRLPEKQLTEYAENLARDTLKKVLNHHQQTILAHNHDLLDIDLALTQALECLYGCDPRIAGKIAKPVLAVIGNYAAQLNLNIVGGPSFMAKQHVAKIPSQNILKMHVLANELSAALKPVISPPHYQRPNLFLMTPTLDNK